MTDRTIRDAAPWEPACAERHMGLWLYEPNRFRALSSAILGPQQSYGGKPIRYVERLGDFEASFAAAPRTITDGEEGPVLYRVTPDGMGVVRILGTMMKGDSKFGGTSTIRTRRALRAMVADDGVKAVMVAIDSGGGTAAGTDALADEVAATGAAKPTAAYIDDLGASAALWVASQAGRISANRLAQVGSIGTVGVIWDTSEAFARDGIKVHVIASAGAEGFKGAGADGAKLTVEQIGEFRREVNAVNERFLADIARGRRMPMDRVREMADGRVHIADEAKALGLIDAVESFDQAATTLMGSASAQEPVRGRNGRRVAAEARLRLSAVRRT